MIEPLNFKDVGIVAMHYWPWLLAAFAWGLFVTFKSRPLRKHPRRRSR